MLSNAALDDIFVGDGEMSKLMRAHDWEKTSLGDPRKWPEALKVAVRILLTSRFEMWMGWGPEIAFLYNDAYRPTLGQKHPRSLGMPTEQLWAEIWDDVRPRLQQVYENAEATWDRALLLILERSGAPEETYHTFSYSPLIGDKGHVEGVFCAVTEETERVISERRLASLRSLATSLAVVESQAAVFAAAAEIAAQADRDMPFCVAYRFSAAGEPEKAFETGGESAGLDEIQASQRSSLDRVWNGDKVDPVALPEGHFPRGAWNVPPRFAAVIPLPAQGSERPMGALVVGLNPFRTFDADYRSYLGLFAGQIAASFANAVAFEAHRLRADALAQALEMRKQAAEALRQANERLTFEMEESTAQLARMRSLFKQAPSFMALLSGPEHVFELVNDAYLRLVGHRQLIGLNVREALPEIAGQGYFELLDDVYRRGEAYVGRSLAVRLQRVPGGPLEERFVHLVYQPVLGSDGKVNGIFVDGHDVTHQKLAEDSLKQLNETLEQRVEERTSELADAMQRLERESMERQVAQKALQKAQRMEALGALTGGVAHDFNNLLQVISSNLHLLSKSVSGDPVAMCRLEGAFGGVARGAKLASQLLAFGRRQPLEPRVVNVGRFIRSMDDMLRRAIGEGVQVETIISGGLWNTMIDPGQIENAVLNLAINARDAMDGHGRLTIEAGNAMLDSSYCDRHEDVRPGQYVMIAVTDTGTGIPPEVLERVFEPFFSTKPEGKGTGLGLSMVYGFVKQSGGHVTIYSEPGEGTTVKLYLPRTMEQEDGMAQQPTGSVVGGSETVLVVEDDEDVREATVAVLAELGYHVLKAKDADSALTVIDSGISVDLLFTDVVMPGKLRSPELARKARERLPGIGVLFTSGYTENSIVHGGRLDQGVELLSKPYTHEALARRIRHVLANRAQVQAAAASMGSPAQARPLSAARTPTSERLRILVVEDDDLIRQSTQQMLETVGHVVESVSSGEAALQHLSDGGVDLMVTDIGLPDISGVSLASRARAIQPTLAVVFATGARLEPGHDVVSGGAVVMKPYALKTLLAAIDEARTWAGV